MKILVIALENCKKSPLKYFTEKTVFAKFEEFVYNALFKIACLENSATFTGKSICAEVSFVKKLHVSSLTLFVNKTPTQVFANFLRTTFDRTTPGDCF